tara:strand:+ start:486 stop:725 length:240 start_codon:yes stop_codon:yes gene_type:complete
MKNFKRGNKKFLMQVFKNQKDTVMDNKYVIATGYNRANLCEHVSRYIENGWYPIGGMVIDFNDNEDEKIYCQPMTTLQV